MRSTNDYEKTMEGYCNRQSFPKKEATELLRSLAENLVSEEEIKVSLVNEMKGFEKLSGLEKDIDQFISNIRGCLDERKGN